MSAEVKKFYAENPMVECYDHGGYTKISLNICNKRKNLGRKIFGKKKKQGQAFKHDQELLRTCLRCTKGDYNPGDEKLSNICKNTYCHRAGSYEGYCKHHHDLIMKNPDEDSLQGL